MVLAEVIIEYPASSLDRPFYYAYNENNNLQKGVRVKIPFANKEIIGYVYQVIKKEQTKEEFEKENGYVLKDIIQVIDKEPIINEELFLLAKEISNYYFSPLISVLKTMLPPSLKPSTTSLSKPKIAYEQYLEVIEKDISSLTNKQKELYETIKSQKRIKKSSVSYSIAINLLKKGFLKEIKEEKYRLITKTNENKDFNILNEEQENAKNEVLKTTNQIFLLEGITGSGKTEVYLHLTKEYLKKGKTVLILLPEISLTYQVIKIFLNHFSKIAILHSSLTNSEKYDEYRKISKGEVDIVIGARSSIFAPLKNIGLVIIDEEHSETYKQETAPYYHALTVAKMRQKQQEFNILLGSATPSLESRARAFKGTYKLLKLTKRYKTNLPTCNIVDLASLKEVDEKSIIVSKTLREKIKERLANKEQVLIMLNRRGYATYITCRRCSYTFKCPKCNLPLSLHIDENILKCHHCGYNSKMVSECPKCNSPYLRTGGIAIQKAEQELNKLFPEAKILRLDSDVAKKRLATKAIIDDFQKNKADILLGSQMISKGLDFPNVTLSCILLADVGLNIPSFRASEKIFALLTQTIGRAGRRNNGEAIIQTYMPNHYAIQLAAKQDYETFFLTEMKYRKIASYPPFSYCAILEISSIDEKELISSLKNIKNFLEAKFVNKKVDIIGPSEYYVSFINGKYRRKFLLKYYNFQDIKEVLIEFKNYILSISKLNLQINIDPYEDF